MTSETAPQNTGQELDHAELLRLLHYDRETGVWRWLVAMRGTAAGTEAGCTRSFCGRSYRHIKVKGRSHRAHRLAWFYMTGSWPVLDIDHKDGDGLNNRWGNLREATNSQNLANRGPQPNNTTGFKGVSFNKQSKKFTAHIRFSSKKIHLGYYASAEAAHAAYADAAEKYFGEFARVK